MLKKIYVCFFAIFIYSFSYAETGKYKTLTQNKNGYQITINHCPDCEFLKGDKELSLKDDNDTIQLEYEKAYSDHALGNEDTLDKYFIDATAYKVNKKRRLGDPLVFALLVRGKGSAAQIIFYSNEIGTGILTCYPPKELNRPNIKKLLLTKGCQEAIKEFNIPLSVSDINSLTKAKGSIN